MMVLLALHYLVEGIFHMAKMLYLFDKTDLAQGGYVQHFTTFHFFEYCQIKKHCNVYHKLIKVIIQKQLIYVVVDST